MPDKPSLIQKGNGAVVDAARRIHEWWPSCSERIYQWWSSVREFGYGLKVAWLSFASVILGALLLLFAPQVQDLFLEVTGDSVRSAWFWLLFYISVMIGWGLPVYVSSWWILSRFERGHLANDFPNVKAVQSWVRLWIPPLLVLGCFIAVLLGQLMEMTNAPAILQGTPEARQEDYLRSTNDANGNLLLIALAISNLAFSSFLSHLGSGRVLLLIYLFLGASFVWLYWRHWLFSLSIRTVRIGGKVLWWLIAVIGIIPLLLTLLVLGEFSVRAWSVDLGLGHLIVLPALTLLVAYFAWLALRPNSIAEITPLKPLLLKLGRAGNHADVAAAVYRLKTDLYYGVLLLSVALIAIAFTVHPVRITEFVYRAPLLPILLGVWVAPFTYISYWSVRYRVPIVLVVILISASLIFVVGDTNDVRTVLNAERRVSFKEAVDQWAAVNGCEITTKDSASSCPSPFIMSVAGGASRSAFHAAGVIGKLIDERVFTAPTHRPRLLWQPRPFEVPDFMNAEFSPDGTRIVTLGKWEKSARLWDAKTGSQITTLDGHERPVTGVTFSADSARLVTIANGDVNEPAAQLWDPKTGEQVAVLKGHKSRLYPPEFSPDGTRIITQALGEEFALLWDGKTGRKIAFLEGPIHRTSFSPDGTRLVTSSEDVIIDGSFPAPRLWDAKDGREIAALKGHKMPVYETVFSPNGARFLTIAEPSRDEDSVMRLWDAKTGRSISALDLRFRVGATFSSDGTRIISVPSGPPNPAQLWDGETGQKLASFGIVNTADFSPDGTQIVTTWPKGHGHTARLWDAKFGREVAALPEAHNLRSMVVFSPDGTRIAAYGTSEKTAWLWDAETGDSLAALEGHRGLISAATFSHDGSRLITTAFFDETAWLWDAKTGKRIAALAGSSRAVRMASTIATFSPDGTRIVTSGTWGKAALVWDGRTGQRIAALNHRDVVWRHHFSKDGTRIITLSYDNTPRLWDADAGREIAILEPHSEPLRPFEKQVFAISAVSGGALGAVVAYAALADSQRKDRATNGVGNPPCKRGSVDDDSDWFAPFVGIGSKDGDVIPGRSSDTTALVKPLDVHRSWRGCLQLLTAGDYLSSVLISLFSTDPFHYRGRGGDRAAVLERAWESRYARLTGQKSDDSTLASALIATRKDVVRNKDNWLPILLLNGTSATTGRRIITSDVDMVRASSLTSGRRSSVRDASRVYRVPLFRDATDLHRLFSNEDDVFTRRWLFRSRQNPLGIRRDIRLSTAASTSARFPIISPHGNIRTRDGRIKDRVVDGGYFENFGATTAGELARALEQVGLRPVIILVNNEPTTAEMECVSDSSNDLEKRRALPSAPQSYWFASLRLPLNTVLATRQARGRLAASNLCSHVDDGDSFPNFAKRFSFITVSPDTTNPDMALSMSWWLSKHVQKYLHEQLEPFTGNHNAVAFDKIRAARRLTMIETSYSPPVGGSKTEKK